MFRRFVASNDPAQPQKDRADALFRLHSSELSILLEMAWQFKDENNSSPLGHPFHRSDIPGLPKNIINLFEDNSGFVSGNREKLIRGT